MDVKPLGAKRVEVVFDEKGCKLPKSDLGELQS
jgi:hypothetical protein